MHTSFFDRKLSPREQAALMDAAKQRAIEARHEAIDAFWAAARHALARAAHRTAESMHAKEPACRP